MKNNYPDAVMTEKRDRIIFDALMQISRYIDENYEEEGYLPSESKMSRMFGVSSGTIRSVLAMIAENNFITSYPRRGHYVVPRRYRIMKVGLVLGTGKESPFIHNSEIVSSLIYHLRLSRIHCQIIQSSQPEKLILRAAAHGVRALVWLDPPLEIMPYINDDEQMSNFPQLVVSNSSRRTLTAENGINYIVTNPKPHIEKRIRFLRDRGHRMIVSMDSKSHWDNLNIDTDDIYFLEFDNFFYPRL